MGQTQPHLYQVITSVNTAVHTDCNPVASRLGRQPNLLIAVEPLDEFKPFRHSTVQLGTELHIPLLFCYLMVGLSDQNILLNLVYMLTIAT